MSTRLKWGILGTGRIAKTFAKGVAASKTGALAAVGSRAQAPADAFADEFDIPGRHGSYEALLADPDVRAVYIATPHPLHAEWAIKSAEAGKHILCEKPLAMNHPEATAVVEAAMANDVFLMEAFMYRCHPQTHRLIELIREKAIGEVKLIQASFGFQSGFNAESRIWNNALGGGGILDVGCYPVSMARLIAGAAAGSAAGFADPVEVTGAGRLNPQTKVDEYAVATLKFPGDVVAMVSTSIAVRQENVVRIFGTEGSITVPSPWIPARDGGAVKILLQKKGQEQPEEIVIETDEKLYALEADTVTANLQRRQAPEMSWDDTLGNMMTLDKWRLAMNFLYDVERPEANMPPVARRPLKVRDRHNMKYGRIEGIDKPVSRLLMGVDNQSFMPRAAVMFDDFFERGGNAFDTSWHYGGGKMEKNLGQWVKNRGLREQVVILDKGGHTPYCTPGYVDRQIPESLERLQTDYIDLYLLHRDNLEVPVGEFVDVLNRHLEAGHIRVFGGSNWTLARVDEANEYALKNGKQGFSAVSNNFSLARMVNAVWAGCIAASDPESRAWFAKTQMPLLPWSSQARGFFTDRAAPEEQSDQSLVRSWYSDDNFQRKARAEELAKKYDVLPINIALAYVLCQPFPTFPLIGPRQLSETRTSLPALDIELSTDELKWLNLEE